MVENGGRREIDYEAERGSFPRRKRLKSRGAAPPPFHPRHGRKPALRAARRPEYSREPAGKVRAIRKEDRTCSGKKTRPVLPRSMVAADVPGIAAPGRLTARENLLLPSRHERTPETPECGHQSP
ncbi:MAG: hypothetical protein MdMp014T_2804 [Treponematales bacterium]